MANLWFGWYCVEFWDVLCHTSCNSQSGECGFVFRCLEDESFGIGRRPKKEWQCAHLTRGEVNRHASERNILPGRCVVCPDVLLLFAGDANKPGTQNDRPNNSSNTIITVRSWFRN
eukprot:2717551-Amphidinium_carterae.1